MNKERCIAVVLAAGNGSRMKSNVAKQFMMLCDKPLIFYALNTVEQSKYIDDCILVTGENDLEWVQENIVACYGFQKVRAVIAGGAERCFSVANALRYIKENLLPQGSYIFIHDGARPFLTEEMIKRLLDTVKESHACVAAMPAKDTVKLADEAGFAKETPDRKYVWTIQTPQVFDAGLIICAYEQLVKEQDRMKEQGIRVTDDAGVVELFTDTKVKLVEGSYQNIKITTPEDLKIAEQFLLQ